VSVSRHVAPRRQDRTPPQGGVNNAPARADPRKIAPSRQIPQSGASCTRNGALPSSPPAPVASSAPGVREPPVRPWVNCTALGE